MKKELTIRLLWFITVVSVLSGCLATEKEKEYIAPPTVVVNEYFENLSDWHVQNRGEMQIQISEETEYTKEGSKSMKVEFTNKGKSMPKAIDRTGIYFGKVGKTDLSKWKDYDAVSIWIYQPKLNTTARVSIILIEFINDPDDFSVYEAVREFDGTGWVHLVIPFSEFKWKEWSPKRYSFDFNRLNHIEISFDSDNPVQFTTYIDGLRPVKIE